MVKISKIIDTKRNGIYRQEKPRICFAGAIAGTSKMKFVPFMAANVLGQVGGSLGLAYLGSGMKMETATTAIVFFVTVILALVFSIIWWKKYRISGCSPKIDSKLNW